MTATTAKEGREAVDRFRPEVLLLELTLPGLWGRDLLPVLGRVHQCLPVVVVRATADRRVLARIADHKPFHRVIKPYELEALGRVVAAAADESRARAGRPAS